MFLLHWFDSSVTQFKVEIQNENVIVLGFSTHNSVLVTISFKSIIAIKTYDIALWEYNENRKLEGVSQGVFLKNANVPDIFLKWEISQPAKFNLENDLKHYIISIAGNVIEVISCYEPNVLK